MCSLLLFVATDIVPAANRDGQRRREEGPVHREEPHHRAKTHLQRAYLPFFLSLSPLFFLCGVILLTVRQEKMSVNTHRVVGTPDYLSPEALLGTGHGSSSVLFR
jgi:hypothetical protein